MSKQKPTRAEKPQSIPRAPAAVKTAHRDAPKALELAIERLEASVTELKRERDSLAAQLAAAKMEIAALDTARKTAIDRIDWVIDSLQTALQEKP